MESPHKTQAWLLFHFKRQKSKRPFIVYIPNLVLSVANHELQSYTVIIDKDPLL